MKKLMCLALLACALMQAGAQPRKTIRLVANDWPPYTGEQLPRFGIASDIVATALERAGYAVEISIMPWSRALASVYAGKHDALIDAWMTDERRARLLYSDSYLANDLYLFYTRPGTCDGGAQHLPPGTRIGVGRDYGYSAAFLARYGEGLKPVADLKLSLLKLKLGRVDMVLDDPLVVDHTIRHEPQDLGGMVLMKCGTESLLSQPMHLALRRSFPGGDKVIVAFNAQIKAMKRDGSLEAIVKRLPPRAVR